MRPPKKPLGRQSWILPDKEWLEHQYTVLGKTIGTISAEIGAAHHTVRKWMDEYNMKRRPPGPTKGRWIGEKSPSWRGGSLPALRKEAYRVAEEQSLPQICDHCRSDRNLVIHHKDSDPRNNRFENLQRLCRSCHSSLHQEELREIRIKLLRYEKVLRELGVDPDSL